MYIFGNQIKKIYWTASGTDSIDVKVAAAIARYCGKTLTALTIKNYELKFPRKLHFTALKELGLIDASPTKLRAFSQLESLDVDSRTTKFPFQMRQIETVESLTQQEHCKDFMCLKW